MRRVMIDFEVGEKVRVRPNLEIGKIYDGNAYVEEMNKFRNKIVTIKEVMPNGGYNGSYRIEEDGGDFTWTQKMLYKIKSESPSVVEEKVRGEINMNEVVSAIKELSENINKRTMYDDTIEEVILNKIKNIPMSEVTDELKKKVDDFVKEKYGILPKKIEIIDNGTKKEMNGLFHKKFDEIVKIVKKGVPLMLTGPAGSGKNHTLEQVADALDLDFYFTNAVTQEYKLTGFIDGNGVYQETQFYKAYKDGGLFFLDEVDASSPEALIILNSAIANGYFDFPIGKVTAHPDFRVVCAGNTYGTGADMIYVGRNQLDGATLDRFIVIEFGYDEDIEKKLAYDDELYDFIINLRNVINKNSLRYIISMRATINSTKLLDVGMDRKNILKSAIIKNMSVDDLNVIVNELDGSNEWAKEMREILNERN